MDIEPRVIKIDEDAVIHISIVTSGRVHEIVCEGWLYNTITFSNE